MDHRLSARESAGARGSGRHPALVDIALVVFDLDGTLIDSAPDLAAAVDRTLAARGLPAAGLDKVRDWVGNGAFRLVERALAHAQGKPAQPTEVEAAHTRFLDCYAAAPCEHTRLYPGARSALETMRQYGMACALVTNKPAAFLPTILERFELLDFFTLTLGGDSLPQKKPHPAPLLYAAKTLNIAPNRTLMIGDSRHDVQAGKAAGFRTLGVTYGYNHGDPIAASRPDYVIDSLTRIAAPAARLRANDI